MENLRDFPRLLEATRKKMLRGSGEKSPSKDMKKKFFSLKTQPIGAWKLQCA